MAKLRVRILHRDWKTGAPTDYRELFTLLGFTEQGLLDKLAEDVFEMEQWFNTHTDARWHFSIVGDAIDDPYSAA